MYIELALISNDRISRDEADEFTRMSLHGLTDEILRKKTPIALEDILKPGEDGQPVRRVLVEGAPGVGKSTLAWEVCHKWEELDSVKQYKLVVLVQLRGKRAQEATNISDLFPLSKNNDIEQLLAAIGNGKGVLIILDGFDELPHEQREEGSVYVKLINGMEELPEATVIITSRPSVSAYLMNMCKHSIERHLEILGFTEQKIKTFAESVFSDNAKTLETFLQYIDGNPVIKGMMYLPLNAVFVTSIFKYHHRTHMPYPKTMTQLYDAVIRSLIRRHLVDKKLVLVDYRMPIQTLQCMKDIEELPDPVPDQLLELARIAYEGFRDEKYVFTDLGNKFDHLGIMKKTVSLDNLEIGPEYTFSFLHLTLQEYLSALHMSLHGLSLSDNKNGHSRLHEFGFPFPWHNSEVILRFLAGLCKHSISFSCQKVGDQLMSMENYLQLARCVYESDSIVLENKKILDLLISEQAMRHFFQKASPFDYYLIGHCICHHGGLWDISVYEKKQADFLIQGLQYSGICSSGTIQKLQLNDLLPLSLVPLLLSDRGPEQLHIQWVTFTASSIDIVREYISNGTLKAVQLNDCEQVELLLPIVFGPSSLDRLVIVNDFYFTNDTTSVCLQISDTARKLLLKNSNLKQLDISFCLEHICENSSLDYIADLVLMSIKILKSNHMLQELNILCNDETFSELFEVKLTKGVESKSLSIILHHFFSSSCQSYGYNITQQILQRIPEQLHNFANITIS